MELLAIANSFFIFYFIVTAYQAYMHKHKMTDSAIHHLISHTFIVLFLMISLNLYIYKDYVLPFFVSLAHALQHVMKENRRLIETNKWTNSVKDI